MGTARVQTRRCVQSRAVCSRTARSSVDLVEVSDGRGSLLTQLGDSTRHAELALRDGPSHEAEHHVVAVGPLHLDAGGGAGVLAEHRHQVAGIAVDQVARLGVLGEDSVDHRGVVDDEHLGRRVVLAGTGGILAVEQAVLGSLEGVEGDLVAPQRIGVVDGDVLECTEVEVDLHGLGRVTRFRATGLEAQRLAVVDHLGAPSRDRDGLDALGGLARDVGALLGAVADVPCRRRLTLEGAGRAGGRWGGHHRGGVARHRGRRDDLGRSRGAGVRPEEQAAEDGEDGCAGQESVAERLSHGATSLDR